MATNEWDDVNRPLPGPLPKPTIDDMKYELMRLQHNYPAPLSAYDKAASTAFDVARTVMGRPAPAATDVARTLLGGPAAAVGGAWQGPLQALSAGPGYLYRKYAEGDQQGADAYWKQNVKPAQENMYNLYKKLAEPSTKQGKQFEEDFAAAFEASKLPPIFPGLTSGIPVRGITPTDVRVMGANAKRIGTQVRDIPTDFKNAQSGLKKIDPVTGESTLGAKLQGTAESVGDTLERQADARTARTDTSSMSPLSAAASALMPDTSMNVMRPVDSRILRAKTPEGAAPLAIPASATGSRGDISRLDPLSTELNKHTLTYDEMMKPHPLLNTYMAQYARDNNAVHDVGIDTALAQRALEKFPDAPSPSEAVLALEAFHGGSNSEGMAKEHIAAADAYAKSPLAAAVATQPDVTPIPTSEEFLRRYEASEKWRTNNFPAFVTKYLGTETDPALSLASQGLTFQDPEHVLLAGENSVRTAVKNRVAAGMPEKTALQTALEAKENELAQKDTQWRAIADTREARTFSDTNIKPLQKEIENLKLGAAYENMADAAVIPTKVQDMLGVMDYSATQFFPSLTGEKNPEAIAYKLEKAAIARLGFDDIVDQMHQDILNGKYDPDKVKNISVDRYIRENAEARQKADAAVQALQKAYIAKVTTRFSEMVKNLPADALKYENAVILETTQNTPLNEAKQRASDDCGVLDNCIGKGSDASQSGKQPKHPFTGLANTHYEPVFLLDQPGVRNPRAAQDTSTFIKRVYSGENILGHVRDETTGFPVANIELKVHRRRDGSFLKFVGYVSGPTTNDGTNGPIDQKYHNAIRDYLNRYADKIGSVDSPLINNTSVRDTMSGEYDSIGVEAGYRDNRDLRAANPDLPRFITLDDARSIRNQTYKMPEPAASAVPAPLEIAPYKHIDFVDDPGLTPDENLTARRIIDAIHTQADADANSYNVLHELDNAASHIRDTPQLRALVDSSPPAVQQAVAVHFANLPESQDAPMPRKIVNASTEDLRSQITPADEATLTGVEAHIRGELVNNNVVDPNEYFTLLRDAPFAYFGTDVDPAAVELAIRNVADELQVIRQREIAQAQTPTARQAAAPAPVPPGVLREQVTTFATNVLDELHRTSVNPGYADDVALVLAPLVDRHDYSLGLGPLIDQIERVGNTQSDEIAAELFDFAQYLREEQHIPPGPAVAPVPAPTQNAGGQLATFLDYTRTNMAQAFGQAAADRATEIAHRSLIDQLPNGIPALVADLRDRASVYANDDVAGALDVIAFRIERGDHQGFVGLGAFEPEAPHPAGPGGVQDVAHHLLEIERRPDGTLSTEGIASTAYALLHGQLDYPGFTHIPAGPERAQAMRPILEAFNTAADNELAIQRMRAATHAPPALPAPEPAPAPVVNFSPVNASVQMTDTGTLSAMLRQQTDDNAEAEVADVARRYIQGNAPEDLAVLPHLIRTTATGLHADFGYISRELLARQIEEHLAQQAPPPIGQILLRTPYNELQQAMTPLERSLAMNIQARIARQAADFGIDGAEVADMIRNRSQTYGGLTVNLDHFSPQALEVLARDTSDSIEAQNRARDRRPRQ